MDIVVYFQNLFRSHRYEMTDHAIDSMDEDDIALADLASCLHNGRLRRSWPRIRKYEIEGLAIDGRCIRVVTRLTEDRFLRIITVYEVH